MSVGAAEDGHLPEEPPTNLAHNDEKSIADRLRFLEEQFADLSASFQYVGLPKKLAC